MSLPVWRRGWAGLISIVIVETEGQSVKSSEEIMEILEAYDLTGRLRGGGRVGGV